MGDCGQYKETATPDEKKRKQFEADAYKIDSMVDMIRSDPLIRAGIGIDPKAKGNVIYEFAEWARRRVHRNLLDPNQPMDPADINYLYAEMLRVMDTITRIKKWGDGTTFHARLNKLLYLPQEVFRRDMLGGEDLWMKTQVDRARADGMRDRHLTKSKEVSSQLELVTGVSAKAVNKVLGPLEDRVGLAIDRLRQLEQQGAGKDDIRDAKIELDNADKKLKDVLENNYEKTELGAAINAQYHITLAMEGLRLSYNKSTKKNEIRKMRVKEIEVDIKEEIISLYGEEHSVPIIIKKKIIDPESLQMTMENAIGSKFKGDKMKGIVKMVGDYLSEFGDLARQALHAEKENYVFELTRGKAGMKEDEAREFVETQLKFDEKDIYFPRRSLGQIQKMARLRNDARLADDPLDFIREAKPITDQVEVMERATNPHMRSRIYESQSISRVSHNMTKVLQDYGNEMIQYWHDNRLALNVNRHLDFVRRAWKEKAKTGEDMRWMEEYINGLNDYLSSFIEQSKGIHTSGWLAETSKLLTAWKVGMTMGFLNPSTPLLNLAEGQALLFTRAGKHYAFDAEKENHLHTISKLIEQEYVKVAGEEHLQQESMPASEGRLDELGETKYWRRAEQDTALRWLQNIRKAVTTGAKKGIILQRKAENANRKKAFKTGALMEYEFILKYEPLFRAATGEKDFTKINQQIDLKHYGLKASDFRSEGSRTKAWNKFVRQRVLRAGHEMVYQTQWNYNMVARHYFEGNPIGKMAMMFQHYPLSWVASLRRSYDILNSIRRAGAISGQREGIKAMFHRDTRSKELGMFTNPEMMFLLISGLIGAGITGLRMGTGIVLGQMWQHPLAEVTHDLVKYVENNYNDEPEKNKALLWGQGALQQFTGPLMSDLTDAISLGALKAGIDDGSMPLWLSDVLRGTVGFRPNEVLLTRYGSRKYEDAWDVMTESLLWNGLSIKKKSERIAKSIPGISEQFTGKEATLKDTSYAILRAAGVRDERGIEKWIEGQLAKERK